MQARLRFIFYPPTRSPGSTPPTSGQSSERASLILPQMDALRQFDGHAGGWYNFYVKERTTVQKRIEEQVEALAEAQERTETIPTGRA
ncbi:MAG: hypothetical protein ACP5NB_08350 [Chloroflexia bacterium]